MYVLQTCAFQIVYTLLHVKQFSAQLGMQGVSTLDLGQDTVMGSADQEVMQPTRPADLKPCSTVSLPDDMPRPIYEVPFCHCPAPFLANCPMSFNPCLCMDHLGGSIVVCKNSSIHHQSVALTALSRQNLSKCMLGNMVSFTQGVMDGNLQLLRETHLMDRDYFKFIMTLVKASSEICYHKIRRTG